MPRASGSTPRRARTRVGSLAASMPSTSTRPASGRHQRVEHAQRGGLAGAVRAEQAGDLPVRRSEAHAVDGLHPAGAVSGTTCAGPSTRIMRAPCGPHGSQPYEPRERRHVLQLVQALPSSAFASAVAMNSATSRGPQPDAHHAVALSAQNECREFGSVRCTSSPYRGGVTGSNSPDSSSTGMSDLTGVVEILRHRATRPHLALRQRVVDELRAEDGARRRPGRPASPARPRRSMTDSCRRHVDLFADQLLHHARLGHEVVELAVGGLGKQHRQHAEQLRRIGMEAHDRRRARRR